MWALRAQTDKQEYAVLMRRLLEATPNLHLREGQAVGLDLGPNDEVGCRQGLSRKSSKPFGVVDQFLQMRCGTPLSSDLPYSQITQTLTTEVYPNLLTDGP